MDYLLPRGQDAEPATSGTEEESRAPSFGCVVICCVTLSGLLAVSALVGASLGYEVGLSISLPPVPFNTSSLPPVPSFNASFLPPALRLPTIGAPWWSNSSEGDARSGGEWAGATRVVVELPGPTVEEITDDMLVREDAEWAQRQHEWRGEEEAWRKTHAVNKTIFYMYRAQSSKDYPPENINAADLGGVLWYLHHEIVTMTPRKFDVTRIIRFRVTVKNTEALHRQMGHNFGAFVAFDSGRCTVPTCDQIWNQYGFVVGCQVISPFAAKYSRQSPCGAAQCSSASWYSLPGPCPSLNFAAKSEACRRALPGGECGSNEVTGEAHCTYHVESAGWVALDEFSFIRNYSRFIEEERREYNPLTDRGVRFSFWDGIKDQRRCVWRMNRLQLLFKRKYPHEPALLDPPPCPGTG